MTRRAILLAALMLAGCHQPAATDRQAPAPTPTPAASPAPVAAAAVDLSGYAGHYPADKVGGTAFFDQPAVRAAVAATGAPQTARTFVFAQDGPQTPITLRAGRLIAWQCEAHNCDAHNAALLIAPDGDAAELCYFDADAGGPPRWFTRGRVEAKTESCPSGDAG